MASISDHCKEVVFQYKPLKLLVFYRERADPVMQVQQLGGRTAPIQP
jgi:hypothetical protein